MSQPEMRSASHGRKGATPGGVRHEAATDLIGRPFPFGDWGEPAECLDELYRWAESDALRTIGWYMTERIRKRRLARTLRLVTAAGATAGVALPLLDLTGALEGAAGWGCLSLLLSVACLGCDRYFGLTSAWIRQLATAQAVRRRLLTLQFDWASECVREVLGPAEGTASEAAERCLGVLRRFAEDVAELVRAETADWTAEFGRGAAPEAPRPPARTEREGGQPVRPIPGSRPSMPRQRPPASG